MNGSIPLCSGKGGWSLDEELWERLPSLRPMVFSEVIFLSYSHPAMQVYMLEFSSISPNHLIGYTLK